MPLPARAVAPKDLLHWFLRSFQGNGVRYQATWAVRPERHPPDSG